MARTIWTASRRNCSGYFEGRAMAGRLPMAFSQNEVSTKTGQVHSTRSGREAQIIRFRARDRSEAPGLGPP